MTGTAKPRRVGHTDARLLGAVLNEMNDLRQRVDVHDMVLAPAFSGSKREVPVPGDPGDMTDSTIWGAAGSEVPAAAVPAAPGAQVTGDRAWLDGLFPPGSAMRELAIRNAITGAGVTGSYETGQPGPRQPDQPGLSPWGPRHDPRVEGAVGNADFARVLASVEQEYAAQAARRVRGDDVLWTGRDGRQVPQDSGAAMGMSPGVPQVSRVRQPVPALGCQVCGETGQVLVPCDHDGTDEQDCARCHEGVVCARCHGVGTVTIMVADARGEQVPTSAPCDHQDAGDEQCDQCHGSGKVCVVCGGTGQRAVPCDACASSGPRARPPQPPGQPATGPLPAPELPPDAVPAEPAFLTARRHAIAGPNTSIWR